MSIILIEIHHLGSDGQNKTTECRHFCVLYTVQPVFVWVSLHMNNTVINNFLFLWGFFCIYEHETFAKQSKANDSVQTFKVIKPIFTNTCYVSDWCFYFNVFVEYLNTRVKSFAPYRGWL